MTAIALMVTIVKERHALRKKLTDHCVLQIVSVFQMTAHLMILAHQGLNTVFLMLRHIVLKKAHGMKSIKLSVWPPAERHIKNVHPIHGEQRSTAQIRQPEDALRHLMLIKPDIYLLIHVLIPDQVLYAMLMQSATHVHTHSL